MDLSINDDGKGFEITGTPDRPIKAGETYFWTASDPTAVVLSPDGSDTSTQVKIIGSLPATPKDVTGLVITFTLNRLVGGPLVENVDPPIDIVPDPNGEVGSMIFTEAAL
jgi:hypothetical protein